MSRCQPIRCRPLPREIVQQVLAQSHACDPQASEAIARLSGGSVSAAAAFAGRWAAYERLLGRLSTATPVEWLTQPLPDTREDVTELLDGMMGWLRDVAVAAVGEPADVAPTQCVEDIRRQAAAVDLDRCLATALALVELRESVERFVSPRLVAALARERWLSLMEAGDEKLEAGN